MSDGLAAGGVEPLTVEVRPRWPFRLPRGSGGDGTAGWRRGVLCRLLHVEGRPVLIRAWQPGRQRVMLRADALERHPGDLSAADRRPRGGGAGDR